MKRNLIVIAGIFLGVLFMMILGNIIIIGEKIANLTHLWWMEWVFYGIIVSAIGYYILLPVWQVHRTPAFPVLNISEETSEKQLREFGKRLLNHCNYITDEQSRKEHKKVLGNDLLHASGNRVQLLNVVQQELKLRIDGDSERGILGINGQIKEWAKTVFMITAISQNSKFDTISVMWLNYKMIESLVLASGFRPSNRQMFKIYRDILTTALITYAMSNALMKTGAIAPFDIGDFHNNSSDIDSNVDGILDGETAEINPDDIYYNSQLSDSEGLSVYSILRRIKIPGVVVSAGIDGTVNALMTLRIGYITRSYLQQGEQAFLGINNKRAIKLQAMKDSLFTIPMVIGSGSTVIGKKTTNIIRSLTQKLINQNYNKKP